MVSLSTTPRHLNNEVAFEKTAADQYKYPLKAHLTAIPLVYGYSGYQRSRINQGENVSNLNRYVAENPDNAVIIQAILAPKVYKSGAKVADAVFKKSKDFLAKAIKTSSKYYVKTAGEYNGDLFKDACFDAFVAKDFTPRQIGALKIAATLLYTGNQSDSDAVLEKVALTKEHLDSYLQSAGDYLTIKINEKLAGDIASAEFSQKASQKLQEDLTANSILKYAHETMVECI